MSNTDHNSDNDTIDQADARDLHELCTRLYDHVIAEPEIDRLNKMLDDNSAARKIYLRYVDLQHLLMSSTGKLQRTEAELLRCHITAVTSDDDDDSEESAEAAVAANEFKQRPPRGIRSPLTWAVAAMLLISATIGAFWSLQDAKEEIAENDHLSNTATTDPIDHRAAPLASISYVSSTARATKTGELFKQQANIPDGTLLALAEGEVELTYDTGTKILLVGPAEFVVETAGGKLQRGGLVASVTEEGHGFTIETPNGKIVDLGTEFGVAVDDFGISEVSVFRGKVEAFPHGDRGQGKKFELTKGHGLQWNKDGLTPLDADLRRFVTSVLDLSTDDSAAEDKVSVVDRFRKASLDDQKWTSLGDVQTTNAGLELIGNGDPSSRPYLVSAEELDPARGPITVTCDFRFGGTVSDDSPSLSVLSRSANVRGIALPPWSGTLASCVRCSFGSNVNSDEGVILSGVKMESDRELASLTGSSFMPPAAGIPYRIVMRDDGVNVSFTVSLRDDPSRSTTSTYRSLFRGKSNYIAIEGPHKGSTLIERVEISQEVATRQLSSYADFATQLLDRPEQRETERRVLATLAPDGLAAIVQDDFESETLDADKWDHLGEVQIVDGALQLGVPNDEGHIDTWRGRPYLLTRESLDPNAGTLTILGRISFADNFLAGYGASFAVMTRADNERGHGPGWEHSVLQRGVRANFWPASWDAEHSLEIHEKPVPNTITLLATHSVQVDPAVQSYLFRVVDDGQRVTLTIVDPGQPDALWTISSPATGESNGGVIGFESCWGSPVMLDDVRIYQDSIPDINPSTGQ
ncbi:MAG: FecR domain-containing protein [Bythopirellula sp.]